MAARGEQGGRMARGGLRGRRLDAERERLRGGLGRRDALTFALTSVVVLDTLGAVASGRAEAFTWLLVLACVFLVPSALAVAELGAAFPDEGGHYVWTRLAFGRTVAAVSSVLYWVESPLWIGGSLAITAIAVVGRFATPLDGPAAWVAAGIFVWACAGAAAMPVRLGRIVPAAGALARVVLLGGFTLTVVLYAARHGVHGFGAGDFAPSRAGFFAVVPVLVYNYLGFDLPSTAGDELADPRRDVPLAVRRAGACTVVLYAAPVLAILLVLPQARITGLGGFVDALATVFTVYGGHVDADGTVVLQGAGHVLGTVAAALFVLVLVTSGATWLMGTARSQAIACLDGAGPAALGTIDRRTGTPLRLCVVSGLVASATATLAFAVSGGDAERYFAVALGLAISAIAISYLAIFPALVVLRRRYPDVPRPYRVPGGELGAALASGLATACVAVAVVALAWPGIGTADPDAALPAGFAGERALFELCELVPLAALVALGLAFARLGRPDDAGADVRGVEPAFAEA
jgi:glutamate:GABA antiporter